MQDGYKKLFNCVDLIEPPGKLGPKIINYINSEEKRLAAFRARVFRSTSVASFGFFLWATVYLVNSVQQTGFWQYFSLIFSENGTVLAYWRELSLSIIESLPILSLIIFLAAVGLFIWSSAKVITHPTLSYDKRGFHSISPLR